MADPEPIPTPVPNPQPAPAPQPDQAGELAQRVKVCETALKILGKQVQELADREAARSKLDQPLTRKPLPGFKPGVFKGR